jgi:hypothetical protein
MDRRPGRKVTQGKGLGCGGEVDTVIVMNEAICGWDDRLHLRHRLLRLSQ